MIRSEDIREFAEKLSMTRNEYCKMVEDKESEEMTFSDKITIKIWNERIEHITEMINDLDMLEFNLFV